MLKIDKKLRDDLQALDSHTINSLVLKVLKSKKQYDLIDDRFRNLLSDTSGLVLEYFNEIESYKGKLLSYVVLYLDEVKRKFLVDVIKLRTGVLDKNQYAKKISSIPVSIAFLLSTLLVTSSTTLLNFTQIKDAYQKGLTTKEDFEILKDKFSGQKTTKIIKKVADLTYMCIAFIDKNTCKHFRDLDEKKFKFSYLLKGGNGPPMHPNCRCKMIIF